MRFKPMSRGVAIDKEGARERTNDRLYKRTNMRLLTFPIWSGQVCFLYYPTRSRIRLVKSVFVNIWMINYFTLTKLTCFRNLCAPFCFKLTVVSKKTILFTKISHNLPWNGSLKASRVTYVIVSNPVWVCNFALSFTILSPWRKNTHLSFENLKP